MKIDCNKYLEISM